MPNNILYIRCASCVKETAGKEGLFMLAKAWAEGWRVIADKESIQAFLDEHKLCDKSGWDEGQTWTSLQLVDDGHTIDEPEDSKRILPTQSERDKRVGDRGFTTYEEFTLQDRGIEVIVRESSADGPPKLRLYVEGPAVCDPDDALRDKTVCTCAHMTESEARRVRDGISRWLQETEGGDQ